MRGFWWGMSLAVFDLCAMIQTLSLACCGKRQKVAGDTIEQGPAKPLFAMCRNVCTPQRWNLGEELHHQHTPASHYHQPATPVLTHPPTPKLLQTTQTCFLKYLLWCLAMQRMSLPFNTTTCLDHACLPLLIKSCENTKIPRRTSVLHDLLEKSESSAD